MTKYQRRGVEREREVCFVMLAPGKEISKNMGRETERLPIHGPTSQYSLMMGGGGGGGGGGGVVVCSLSSGGHRSHCMDTVQSPMG